MEVRSGYKQTEVGVIPEGWSTCALGEGITLLSGTHILAQYCNTIGSGVPYLTGPADFASGVISQTKFTDRPATLCKSEDILVTVKGSGAGTLIEADAVYCISRQLMAIRVREWDKKFVFYSLLESASQFRAASTGLIPGLSRSDILEQLLPLPPLSEQRAIATALSDVDALLDALEQLISKKRDLKQAAMQQLLTGQTRLPGFEGEWEVVSMRDVLSQSATYGIVTAGAFVQNGVKMLRGGDIADGRINTDLPMVSRAKAAEYARTALVQNDVVIALVGYPGATAKIPDELIGANISRAVGLLRLNGKVTADFLVCFLNSPDGRRMVLAPSAGSAQQVVNLSALNKLQFTIPSLPEQAAIATILTDMDAELAVLEQRLAKTCTLKQGMMQELLTGRTRLV